MQFKVGYYDFSENVGMNFQLNRFYSFGALEKTELMEIGRKATDFEKWIALFTEAGEKAAEEGDHMKAALCFRAAQFYTLNDANLNSIAAVTGAFRHVRLGPSWWFNDTLEGIKRNIKASV